MADVTPIDNLFRGLVNGVALDERADTGGSGSLMHGHFTVFNRWTEIDSWFEGRFLERIAPGAAKKTIREHRDQVRVQFDHGYDYHVGAAPLGPIDELREDDEGVYYEVPLLDTDYNRDRVLPLLQGRTMSGEQHGSLLGASFRFRITREEWVREPKASDQNPEALPERTIREFRLFEFGPVVFPAYPDATAGARSLTDHYLERLQEARSARSRRAPAADPGTGAADPVTPPSGHLTDRGGLSLAAARTQLLRLRRA